MLKREFINKLENYFTDEDMEKLEAYADEMAKDYDAPIEISYDVVINDIWDSLISIDEFNRSFETILNRNITQEEFKALKMTFQC